MSYVYTLHMSKRSNGALGTDLWIRPSQPDRDADPLMLQPVRGHCFPCDTDLEHARNVLKLGRRSVRIRYHDHNRAVEAMRAIANAVAPSDGIDPLPIYRKEAIAA
jgi:hypothetical protein